MAKGSTFFRSKCVLVQQAGQVPPLYSGYNPSVEDLWKRQVNYKFMIDNGDNENDERSDEKDHCHLRIVKSS